MSRVPDEVLAVVGADADWSDEHAGLSGTPLWHTSGSLGSHFVKRGTAAVREHHRLSWLTGLVSVPVVRAFVDAGEESYLVLEDVRAPALLDGRDPVAAASAMGTALRALHALPVRECPFDARLAHALLDAHNRLAANLVDTADFDPDHAGRGAEELFAELVRRKPDVEDLVVTHGDFTPANVLLRANGAAVLIDLGGVGVADRYRDVALAHRDLLDEHGADAVAAFLAAYGLSEVDEERLYWYRLLDEFC